MFKRILSLAFAVILLFCIASCGKTEGPAQTTEERTLSSLEVLESQFLETYAPEETAESYVGDEQANVKFDGYEFTFLNADFLSYMYVFLDPDMTGDTLDDAIYMRNFEAEQKFDITINEEQKPGNELASHAKTIILAEEDIYDAMYIRTQDLTPLIAENLFVDLLEVKELNMHNVWWDQPLIKENIIEDRLFYATSDMHLAAFEGVWALYFNEQMLEELQLESPYEMALTGKWTLEQFEKYCKAAVNLNGDASFEFDVNGNATYGTSTFQRTNYLLYAMGIDPFTRNAEGRFEFSADKDTKYQDVVSKLINFWGSNNGYVATVNSTDLAEDGYFTTFMNNRALFLTAELKGCTMLREWDGTFGLLPMPKYDENQESYKAFVFAMCPAFCIPNTNTNLERTGIIVDYLTYRSYESVVPRYYDIHVSLKALSKQESKDVLAIIRGCRGGSPAAFYDWTNGFEKELETLIVTNNGALASTIEKYKSACEEAVKATYEGYPTLNKVEY